MASMACRIAAYTAALLLRTLAPLLCELALCDVLTLHEALSRNWIRAAPRSGAGLGSSATPLSMLETVVAEMHSLSTVVAVDAVDARASSGAWSPALDRSAMGARHAACEESEEGDAAAAAHSCSLPGASVARS